MARTRAEDFEDKQASLLDSAAAVIAEHGLDKTSMSIIAREAGVSKSLLYHYYSGKEELIFSIIETHLIALDAAVAEADDPALPADQRLRGLVRAMLEAYRGADNEHYVQLNASRALTKEQRAQIILIERRLVKRFSRVIAEINPRLAEPGGALTPVTMSLFGMMNWVYMWFREDGAISRADYADLATTLILEGVRGLDRDQG